MTYIEEDTFKTICLNYLSSNLVDEIWNKLTNQDVINANNKECEKCTNTGYMYATINQRIVILCKECNDHHQFHCKNNLICYICKEYGYMLDQIIERTNKICYGNRVICKCHNLPHDKELFNVINQDNECSNNICIGCINKELKVSSFIDQTYINQHIFMCNNKLIFKSY